MTSNFPAECKTLCENRYFDEQPGGGARFDVVERDHDRIIWLDVMPVPPETREQLLAHVTELLPQDAMQVDAGQQSECTTVQFRSEVLGKAYRRSGLKDVPGLVDLSLIDVVLFSGDVLPSGRSPPYTPNQITEAQIYSGYRGSTKTSTC